MSFTAKDVKDLREKTGVGMMDCKKALEASDGDMDKAIDFLREKGLAAATKKASRIAAEGAVLAYTNEAKDVNVLIEVNSETDFVAKNEKFQNFVLKVAKTVADKNPASVEELLAVNLDGSDRTVQENLQDMVLAIGENLQIRRFERVEGLAASYIHAGGAVGVLVPIETNASDIGAVLEMGKNIAMQVAAMSPEYLSKDDISADELAKMKKIIIDSSVNNPETLPMPLFKGLIEFACDTKRWSDEDIAIYNEKKDDKKGMSFLYNFISDEAKETLSQISNEKKDETTADQKFIGATEGRLNKQIKEICLLSQEFVRGDLFKGSVEGYVNDVAKKLGADIKVKCFIRFAKGEGLQKREDNFAAEIASMVN
jgi:elongation factor Ts